MVPSSSTLSPPANLADSADRVRREVCQSAISHMVDAVAAARIEADPFPHFIVQGIFPDDLYRELLASLPNAQLYEAFSYLKHSVNGLSNRTRFCLTDQSVDQLLGHQRAVWLGVRDALGSPELKQIVFRRLAGGLAYRFGITADEACRMPGYPLPELFRETGGYRIKPHPDTRRKLVAMQLALPKDDRQQHLGTEFYRHSLNPLSLFREPRGFKVAKRAPFLPNVCYAFAVINTMRLRSWHGRTTIDRADGVRNSILNIWYAKPEDGNPDLVRQYYAAD